jgi:mannan endo-1,4-beta-mannosidase
MRKNQQSVALLGLFCLVGCFVACQPNTTPTPAQVRSSVAGARAVVRTKASIIQLITDNIANQRLIVGQHCGNGDELIDQYATYISSLSTLTGNPDRIPALFGGDLGYLPDNDYPGMVQRLTEHWNRGGLVTLSWHADNPWVRGYESRWNSVTNKRKINLLSLLGSAPRSTAKTSYRAELYAIGNALLQLKNNNVQVLWRPFHEMNGNWFWWGINEFKPTPSNAPQYVELWKDMYRYLNDTLQLNNLIWVYSPNKTFAGSGSVTAAFPGAAYVDLVGEDAYDAEALVPDMAALQTLGKPLVLAETGPDETHRGQFDQNKVIDNLRGKVGYFLQWSSWAGNPVAIKDNLNALQMLQRPDAITLDRLPPATITP